MQTTDFIWHNDQLVPWDDAKIHVLSHTLHYGGGAFEGIRFYNTDKGPAIFKLNEHVDRLLYSAKALKMPFTYDKQKVCDVIKEVVRANKLNEGYIRPIVFYGYGKMGVNPVGAPVNFSVACWPWGAYLPHECVDIKTSQYIRIHPDSTIVDAKLCGHYVNSILASLELQGTHYHEVLFLDSVGYISEGAGENFFIIKNEKFYTPKLGTILPGITRKTVMQLINELGYDVQETDITLEDALQADEAFFTGTAAEVTPIRSINDRVLGDGHTGPLTAAVKEAYLNVVRGKNPAYSQCLTYL